VQEGDFVVAMGKAPTLAQPVTVGQVAAILRNVRSPSLPGLTTLISSSAPLSQGNSGGPLADAQGRVIGINVAESLTQGGSGESRGGLSIPAPIVLDALKQVLERQ
jgi:S1-C subfamily serine protease